MKTLSPKYSLCGRHQLLSAFWNVWSKSWKLVLQHLSHQHMSINGEAPILRVTWHFKNVYLLPTISFQTFQNPLKPTKSASMQVSLSSLSLSEQWYFSTERRCVCICVCLYVCVHVCMCIHASICGRHMPVHISVCVCACMHSCADKTEDSNNEVDVGQRQEEPECTHFFHQAKWRIWSHHQPLNLCSPSVTNQPAWDSCFSSVKRQNNYLWNWFPPWSLTTLSKSFNFSVSS